MTKQTITIANDFHNSTARVRVNATGETYLSAATVRRVRRTLCGISDCTCGGFLGQRGKQVYARAEEMAGGEAMIIME
jgi:hypothetical protein